MARNPLIIQRPEVSLIGGNALPQASGLGVPIPDLYGPFATLGQRFMNVEERRRAKKESEAQEETNIARARIRQNAEANKLLADRAAGELAGEGYIPIDPETGKYNPLPGFDQYKDANWNEARRRVAVNKAENQIRNDIQARLDAIDARADIDEDAKVALAKEALEGFIAPLPAEMQELARGWGNDQIRQRSQRSAQRVLDAEQKALDTDAEQRMINFGNEAGTALQSGDSVASSAAIEKGLTAIDDLATLRKWKPDTVKSLKENYVAEVQANGIGMSIHDHLRTGRIATPDMVRQMGEALQHGGKQELKVLVPGGRDRLSEIRTYKADQIREMLKDPKKAERFGEQLIQMAQDKEARDKAYEKDTALFDEMHRENKANPPAASLIPEFNKKNEEAIQQGLLDSEDGLNRVVEGNLNFGHIADPFLQWMLRNAEQGNYADAQRVIAKYQYMKEANWGEFKLGDALVKSISAKDQSRLDMIDMLLRVAKNPDEFERIRAEAGRKGGDPDATIVEYNKGRATGAPTFEQQLETRFRDTFGQLARFPNEMREEAKFAWHTYTIMNSGNNPEEALDKAWELIEKKWEANPIYLGGSNRGDPLTNYDGYELTRSPNSTADPSYEWFQNSTKTLLTDLLGEGILALSEKDRADLERDLADQTPFGETLWIQATGKDKRTPQYTVWWMSETGQKMLMITDDGKQKPLVIDPHRERGNLSASELTRQRQEQIDMGKDAARRTIEKRQKLRKDSNEFRLQEREFLEEFGLDPLVPEKKQRDEFQELWGSPEGTSFDPGTDPGTTGSVDEWWKDQQRLYTEISTTSPSGDAVHGALFDIKATGAEVAAYAAQAVVNIVPMADGGQFLLDVAGYESNYGQDPETFRLYGDVGITQINTGPDGAFWGVKHKIAEDPDSNVAMAAERLKQQLGIDLVNASITDLHKPIYAMAFARLHMLSDPRQIPVGQDVKTRSMQAYLYKQKYNGMTGASPADQGDENSFFTYLNGSGRSERKLISAYESQAVPYGGPGVITDMSGKPDPRNFTTMTPRAQEMAYRLSEAFGQPLQITPHGGRSGRASTQNHPAGLAMDIYVKDMSNEDRTRLIATAIKLGYRGIGTYGPGSVGYNTIHFDIRPSLGNGPGNLALWYHTNNGDWRRAPQWYRDGISRGLVLRRDASA